MASVRTPDQYLQLVFEHVERDAYYFPRLSDWANLQQHFLARSKTLYSTTEVYPLIRELLMSLKDNHSHFIVPETLQATQEVTYSAPLPNFDFIDDLWGYLELPTCGGSDAFCQKYIDTAHQSFRANPDVSGWIVDLRTNHGGNMWAMLPIVGVLLGEGTLGKFIARDELETFWGYRKGASICDGEAVFEATQPTALQRTDIPIALLLSGETASSGEIIAAAMLAHPTIRSFGKPTRGIPTANTDYILPDGAMLILTTALTADRYGKIYENAIIPDSFVENVHSDECLTAAIEWLSTQRSILTAR